jgi:hypothetical protein
MEQLNAGNCTLMIFLRDIHSIKISNYAIGKSIEFFTYSLHNYVLELANKDFKVMKQSLLQVIPDLLIVEGTYMTYKPSISKRDPRNPFGVRYNKGYPRSYVVAEIKQMKKDPHGIDDAIAAAKRDGSMPSDWNILAEGVSTNNPPPGVPCIFPLTAY